MFQYWIFPPPHRNRSLTFCFVFFVIHSLLSRIASFFTLLSVHSGTSHCQVFTLGVATLGCFISLHAHFVEAHKLTFLSDKVLDQVMVIVVNSSDSNVLFKAFGCLRLLSTKSGESLEQYWFILHYFAIKCTSFFFIAIMYCAFLQRFVSTLYILNQSLEKFASSVMTLVCHRSRLKEADSWLPLSSIATLKVAFEQLCGWLLWIV